MKGRVSKRTREIERGRQEGVEKGKGWKMAERGKKRKKKKQRREKIKEEKRTESQRSKVENRKRPHMSDRDSHTRREGSERRIESHMMVSVKERGHWKH